MFAASAFAALAWSAPIEGELAAFVPFYAMIAAMILGTAAVQSFLQ
ncbi:MAG TPA: hypothetical protein VG826_31090 [Pirellulales bacterium]|nr:hypothetical protein [Pirellulales bacterium]